MLVDYGFDGLHVTDFFCPGQSVCANGDFSIDMIEQFLNYLGMEMPIEIKSYTDDTTEHVNFRGDWVWGKKRQEWIEFHLWRWGEFWKKLCDRLHSINKTVFVLGQYCTDPFATMYTRGVDLSCIADADRVEVVSKFPLLPVKFSDEKVFTFGTQDYPGDQHTFRVLVPQGGVSVVDLYLK